jgi:hypothetical protein
MAADAVPPGTEEVFAARRTAALLNRYLRWCHRELDGHPLNRRRREAGRVSLNALICQRAGRLDPVSPFADRWGLRGLIIAAGFMYLGLGRLLGMAVEPCRDSADPGADLATRLRTAIHRLDDHDFVHVHTKAPGAAAHTGEGDYGHGGAPAAADWRRLALPGTDADTPVYCCRLNFKTFFHGQAGVSGVCKKTGNLEPLAANRGPNR